MNDASWSPAVETAGTRRSITRMELALACVTGLEVALPRMDSVEIDWSLQVLLPLWAVWIARRRGVASLWPLVVFAVLPRLSFSGFYGFCGWGWHLSDCLLALGAGIAFAPNSMTGLGADAIFPGPGRKRVATIGAALYILLAALGDQVEIVWTPQASTVVRPLSAIPVAMLLTAVEWRACLRALGLRDRPSISVLLPATLAVVLLLRLHVTVLSLGTPPAALVPVAFFLAAVFGWGRPAKLGALLAAGIVPALVLAEFGPFRGSRGAPPGEAPWELLTWHVGAYRESVLLSFGVDICAIVLGRVFAYFRRTGGFDMPARAWAGLALVLSTTLVAASYGYDARILGGAAFVAGWAWPRRGAWAVPAAMQVAVVGGALASDPAAWQSTLIESLVTIGTATLCYAMVGGLIRRRPVAEGYPVPTQAARVDDISGLSDAVQRLDRAATIRAFSALLLPLLVLLYCGDSVVQMIRYGILQAFDDDPGTATLLCLSVLVTALSPFAFVLADWINRRDELWPLSGAWALGLGILGASAMGLAAGGACFLLRSILENGLPPVAEALQDGQWMQAVAALAAIPVVAVWWWRTLQLRCWMAQPLPRELFLGPVRRHGLWARLSAIFGMPSSMWAPRALLSLPYWPLLASRPLVYAGGIALGQSDAIGAVAVSSAALFAGAGHASFLAGKRLASHSMWVPDADEPESPAPILFLRSFDDDQFMFRRASWNLPMRWFDLWSFRRNADELLVDEAAQFGPVVALGNPNDRKPRFGARRFFAGHGEWRAIVEDTAQRACTVVLAAGDTPGLRLEIEMLRANGFADRTLLLFQPDPRSEVSNRRSLAEFLGMQAIPPELEPPSGSSMIALLSTPGGPRLLVASRATASAYVLALRLHLRLLAPQAS